MSNMFSLKFLYDSPIGALLTGGSGSRRQHRQNGKSIESSDSQSDKSPRTDDPLTNEYVSGIPMAQWHKDFLLQGYLVPPHILDGLDDFRVRDDDTFIITYPKSGTTWMEEIVSLIYNDVDVDKVKNKLLPYRVHHLEVGPPVGHLWHLKKLKSPRILATHLPLHAIPKQLVKPSSRAKIIYVVRNPMDNAVSYYHHHRMSTFLGNFKGTWDDFLKYYTAGCVVYGSWWDHVLNYWRFYLENKDRVLFVSFEELKIDLASMIRRISAFLGKHLTDEQVRIATRHCSFEQMKSNQMVNREKLPITDVFDMSQSKFMRKGIIGDWKNYFTPEQATDFIRVYEERMKNSGLNLVFEPEEAFDRMRKYGRIVLEPDDNKNSEEAGNGEPFCRQNGATGNDIDNPEVNNSYNGAAESKTESNGVAGIETGSDDVNGDVISQSSVSSGSVTG